MQQDSLAIKVSLAMTPAVLVIPFSLGLEIILGPATSPSRIMVYPILGVLGGALLYRLTTFSSERIGLGKLLLGKPKGLAAGIVIGLLVSFSSAGLYWVAFGEPSPLEPHLFFEKLGVRAWGNLSPAFLEEVGFRGGMVFFVNSFWGITPALAAGSVSFGLAHLAGGLLGQSVGIMHVLGTTMAGLLLTTIFLRYGLLACIGCHWVWNALVGSWTRVLQIQGQGPAQAFESAWTTIVVLAIACAILLWSIASGGGGTARQENSA